MSDSPLTSPGGASWSKGEMIGRGRTSEVFAYGDGRVVKLYPPGQDRAAVEREAAASALAHELGVPSVRCDGLVEIDGQVGIVFERFDGPSLTELAERDLAHMPATCRVLADLHVRTHAAHTAELRDVRQVALSLLDAEPLRQETDGLTPAEGQWLRRHLLGLPDGDSLLHLDYHSQNAFQNGDGYVVIDWYSACRGHPAADVAMSVVMMREAELFPGTPPLKLLLYSAARRLMLHFYLRRYLATGTVTAGQAREWRTCARILRLGLLDVASERARLGRRIRAAARRGAKRDGGGNVREPDADASGIGGPGGRDGGAGERGDA
ncbi:MAG: phosphotransferase, partial [Bifidobacteriaceae bacterium]|nr:phosphotransferase [Bifidobacteriaceae bacterium]